MIPWLAVQFGINYTRKVSNFTQLRLVKLQTLLVQFIPNCTASHGITYTNSTLNIMLKCMLVSNPIKDNTYSFLLPSLNYTATLSVKKVSWVVKCNSMRCCSLVFITHNFRVPPPPPPPPTHTHTHLDKFSLEA